MIVPLAMSSAAYKPGVPLRHDDRGRGGELPASTARSRRSIVNDMLITELLPIRNRIRELRREKAAARSVAESSTKKAFANAKVEIERLAAQLDKGQALDLRWTIIGLVVSAGGMWLSYWV